MLFFICSFELTVCFEILSTFIAENWMPKSANRFSFFLNYIHFYIIWWLEHISQRTDSYPYLESARELIWVGGSQMNTLNIRVWRVILKKSCFSASCFTCCRISIYLLGQQESLRDDDCMAWGLGERRELDALGFSSSLHCVWVYIDWNHTRMPSALFTQHRSSIASSCFT